MSTAPDPAVMTLERPYGSDPMQYARIYKPGDPLDGALLGAGMSPSNPDRARTFLATLAVAPVVALDLIYALRSD